MSLAWGLAVQSKEGPHPALPSRQRKADQAGWSDSLRRRFASATTAVAVSTHVR
jgi:hypothetical protein